MPWNVGSVGKTQAKAGGQTSLPRLLREAAAWDCGWKEPSNQEFPGKGKCRCTHLSLGMEITGGNGWKCKKEWGEETFMGSAGWLPSTPTASQLLIHGKNPNTTFTAPSLLTQLHTALLWGGTYTEVGWKINLENHPVLKNVQMRQRQEVVSYSQPARRYW